MLFHNVAFLPIRKLTIKRIHFAILKYKSPLSSSLTIKICTDTIDSYPLCCLIKWTTFLVVKIEFSLFPNLTTPLRQRWRCQCGFIFAFEGHCISFKQNIEPGFRRGISMPSKHFAYNAFLAESITREFPLKITPEQEKWMTNTYNLVW